MDGQAEQARNKFDALIRHGVQFSEFGTRRRRSYKTQDLILKEFADKYHAQEAYNIDSNCNSNGHSLYDESKFMGRFLGTSNVHFAIKYDLKAVGTIAHEYIMAESILHSSIDHANLNAMNSWKSVYPTEFQTALTDTYTTSLFMKDYGKEEAWHFKTLRQDSGDPFQFMDMAIKRWKELGLDLKDKSIIFSDSLNIEESVKIRQDALNKGIQPFFGIGTFFTNDFTSKDHSRLSHSLNIVMKLWTCNRQNVVKLSDTPGKVSGESKAVEQVLAIVRGATMNS